MGLRSVLATGFSCMFLAGLIWSTCSGLIRPFFWGLIFQLLRGLMDALCSGQILVLCEGLRFRSSLGLCLFSSICAGDAKKCSNKIGKSVNFIPMNSYLIF